MLNWKLIAIGYSLLGLSPLCVQAQDTWVCPGPDCPLPGADLPCPGAGCPALYEEIAEQVEIAAAESEIEEAAAESEIEEAAAESEIEEDESTVEQEEDD